MRRAWLIGALLLGAAPATLAEEIELVSGEILQAEVFERANGYVVIDHPLMGRIQVPAQHVLDVRPGKLEAAVDEAAAKTGEAATAAEKAEATKPAEAQWKWSVEVGAAGTDGNVDNSALHAAINGLLEDERDRWTVGVRYDYADTEDEKTKDQGSLGVRKDWLLPESKWFVFAGGRFDYDDFQDWDFRVTAEAGVGYQWIKEEDRDLRWRIGGAATREYEGSDDSWRAEGLLGFDGKWKLTESQSLETSITLYPDLEDSGEYRAIGDLGWKVKMNTLDNLSLKVGIHNEYDSHRERPFDRNDFQWFIALLFDL